MTQDKNMEHLGDGMAEAIINVLSAVDSLRVPARNSTFVFKGSYHDIREIGHKLDVDAVLEGSIQKSGDRFRISAQLIRVSDDQHLWSEQYDSFVIDDIFSVQDSISLAILRELKFTLLGKEKEAIVRRYTNDPDAYELYLQGRRYLHAMIYKLDWKRGLPYFLEAIEKDPIFALAYAGLAEGYYLSGDREKSRKALEKALEFGESFAEVQTTAGYYYLNCEWDFPAAERTLKKALSINPGYVPARHRYAVYLRVMGQYEEALAELKQAREDDPLTSVLYSEAMWLNISLEQYDEVIENYRKAIELDPENETAYGAYLRFMLKQGHYKKAWDYLASFTEELNILKAYVLALSGEQSEAQQLLDDTLKKMKKSTGVLASIYNTWISIVYIALGDFDTAFEYLNRAYEEREQVLIFIKDNYEFDPLRSDPRFNELIRKIGLPVD